MRAKTNKSERVKASGDEIVSQLSRVLREAGMLVTAAIGLYLMMSLITYHPSDPGWSNTGPVQQVYNAGGVVGAWLADVMLFLFGHLAYLLPIIVIHSGWLLLKRKEKDGGETNSHLLIVRWTGFLILLVSGCGLASLHFAVVPGSVPLDSGGVLGQFSGKSVASIVGDVGSTLLLFALFLAGITLFTGLSWLAVMDVVGLLSIRFYEKVLIAVDQFKDFLEGRRKRHERVEVVEEDKVRKKKRKPVRIDPVIQDVKQSARVEKEKQIPLFDSGANSELPALSLLDAASIKKGGYSRASLEAMSRQLELKLQDFGINVEVEAVHPGPVITRFEIQPAAGVKVSQISNLAKDLARALSVTSVRVVEIIPGKSVIGLEIPNEQRELVVLSEILKSQAYDDSSSSLTLCLGKDIGGSPVVADLGKMPHLLVAGTTGSGKSVAVNAMLLSLLFKASPDQVRLILVDPKMLELNVYQGIPHLLAPVVTDMKEAANALRWCVAEMERRYKLMSSQGVRNITGYNRKVKESIDQGKPIPDPLYKPELALDPTAPPPTLEVLPYIVVVIDELADMMMVVGKKVEELIARLAQKARASGIHLILATQRPSVDVITGLIKANIPTRIAFQVSSKVDSRTILDQMGAESLLGHGDMLYMPPGTAIPTRVHGAFVDDHEVHNVVEKLKQIGEPSYIEGLLEENTSVILPGEKPTGSDDDMDPLYDEAIAIVTETRKASISYIQRRLKIGYNRAARMIEEMEMTGVVSGVQSNGSREVIAPPPPSA